MKAFFLRLFGIGRTLWEFFLPLLAKATATALEELLPVALDIVADLASSDRPGEEKRGIAVSRLQDAAMASGVKASASVLNLAVEMAVQKLKEVQ